MNDTNLLCDAVVARLLSRLDRDLAVRGQTWRSPDLAADLDPVAVDYLMLGSRLGTEALRRDCFEGWHPDDIPSYFRPQNVTPLWRQHCAMLDRIDPASPQAAVIMADVRAGFEFFGAAAREQESAGDLCFEE